MGEGSGRGSSRVRLVVGIRESGWVNVSPGRVGSKKVTRGQLWWPLPAIRSISVFQHQQHPNSRSSRLASIRNKRIMARGYRSSITDSSHWTWSGWTAAGSVDAAGELRAEVGAAACGTSHSGSKGEDIIYSRSGRRSSHTIHDSPICREMGGRSGTINIHWSSSCDIFIVGIQ